MTIALPVASCKNKLSKSKKKLSKGASRWREINVKSSFASVPPTHPPSPPCPRQVGGNTQVKPPGAVATAAATQAPKTVVTIVAAPTRGVASAGMKPTANKNYNGGKNENVSNKSASMNATAKAIKPNADMNAKSTAPFALNDVTAGSVHRARQIGNTNFKRFQKLYNFFITSDEATARAINANVSAKRDQVDQWVRGAVNFKALAYIHKIRQGLLVVLIVSTTLVKYGERSSSSAGRAL
ncbi:hypothetical protein PR003_g7518 [Phytophthora rubi]|uniref:Uncharacterized protein n=2 Tax=Phytophthora rubi TaxID=129364 RepID=A0A6A4FP89_9STRA|nr:hypothetical protein PR001_g3935 [Phytophthora rubi]KAE9346281.1 hypothetical protein PR003_g7518 [Phytophthora rubi]